MGGNDFSNDNSFDFTAGNIHLTFDPTLDFSTFDSSAYNFDTNVDFAQDPALEQYSQQWCDNYTAGFDTQAPLNALDAISAVNADIGFAPTAQMEVPSQTYNAFDGQFDPQVYSASQDQQAYGGAGQEVLKHDDDALAALQSLATGQIL